LLLCVGLAACSASVSPTSTAAGGAQSPAGASASDVTGATATPVGAGASSDASAPCALVTQAEAEDAVGQPLTAGVENAPLGMCTYNSSDLAAGVQLTVGSWDSMAAAAHGNGADLTAVTGVGDEALNLNGPDGPSLLYVRKGSTGFLLTMEGPNIDSLPDHGLAKEEALAALILPRL
jgi:hypothetical protein